MSAIGLVFIFSALNEALIEYFFGSIEKLRPYLPTLALAIGIGLAFLYDINIFKTFLGIDGNPFFDHLLSGFIISRGSNFVNDLARKALGSK